MEAILLLIAISILTTALLMWWWIEKAIKWRDKRKKQETNRLNEQVETIINMLNSHQFLYADDKMRKQIIAETIKIIEQC